MSQTYNITKKAGYFVKISILFMLLLLVPLATAYIEPDGVSYYDFDSLTDQWNSNDATCSSCPSTNIHYPEFNIIGDSSSSSLYFDSSSLEFVETPKATGIMATNGALSLWFNATDLNSARRLYDTQSQSYFNSRVLNSGKLYFTLFDDTDTSFTIETDTLSLDTWYHMVSTYNNTFWAVYINGEQVGNQTISGGLRSEVINDGLNIGRPRDSLSSISYYWEGLIDEVKIYDDYVFPENVSNLYNYGSINDSGASVPATSFKVNVADFWDDGAINNIWVYVDSTNYTNVTGSTITTNLYQNDTNNYNIQVGASTHFTKEYTSQAVSSNLNAKLYATDITFSLKNTYNRNLIMNPSDVNITIDGVKKEYKNYVGGTIHWYLDVDTNKTALVEYKGYYPQNFTFNTTYRQEENILFTGLYTTKLNIYPRDILNNNTINDTNITLTGLDFVYNETINGVSNAVFNVTGGNYTLSIVASDRADYEENISINGSIENYTFYAYMYAYNSLWVYAYKQADSTSITNFNVSISNANNSYSDSTNSGVIYLDNITSGVYDVVISAIGYAIASYSVTMTDNSYQTLNAYLSGATDQVIFNVVNWNTYNIIEGATITQKKYVNDTLTTIASKTSNIVGQVPLTYENGIEYTFVASNTGYETRNFLLEILQEEYTIRLLPLSSINTSVYFDDITITIEEAVFREGNSYIVIDFGSPEGSLENYSINIDSNYNNTYLSGNSATGSTLNATIGTPAVSYGESAIVTIKYKSSLNAGFKEKTIIYAFDDWTADSGSLEDIKEDVEDLDDIEKILYATFIILFFAGIMGLGGIAMGEGITLTALGGIFGIAITGLIGLMAWKVAYAPLFILFMIIIFKLRGD